jgi:hypothetical protein
LRTATQRNAASGDASAIARREESWVKLLADAEQLRAAREMVRVLTVAGVDEVMAFDSHRRIRVQGAGGNLRLPGAPGTRAPLINAGRARSSNSARDQRAKSQP